MCQYSSQKTRVQPSPASDCWRCGYPQNYPQDQDSDSIVFGSQCPECGVATRRAILLGLSDDMKLGLLKTFRRHVLWLRMMALAVLFSPAILASSQAIPLRSVPKIFHTLTLLLILSTACASTHYVILILKALIPKDSKLIRKRLSLLLLVKTTLFFILATTMWPLPSIDPFVLSDSPGVHTSTINAIVHFVFSLAFIFFSLAVAILTFKTAHCQMIVCNILPMPGVEPLAKLISLSAVVFCLSFSILVLMSFLGFTRDPHFDIALIPAWLCFFCVVYITYCVHKLYCVSRLSVKKSMSPNR
ncbi:MAG: hypothetical protein LAT64_04530 [Phycisphaerales bacterium]|nr:hypothetical protein [Planctomycetota bacterium]MCH8508019.1 hypothetical protein [Phycisphaerales bacterium]